MKQERYIEMIGEYKNRNDKTLFKCLLDGHIWKSTWSTINCKKYGCPKCAGILPLTKDMVNERLLKSSSNITMIGDYVGSFKKTLFKCADSHIWSTSATSVLQGRGCPSCAEYGFNPNKKAYVYLLKFESHLKYGITNSPKSRMKSHEKNGNYQVIMMMECDGHNARDWERQIKQKFGGNFVNKTIMPDGYTETLPSEHTQYIISTMISLRVK